MICPNCGKESNARFCTYCGTPLFSQEGPGNEQTGPNYGGAPAGPNYGPNYGGAPAGPNYGPNYGGPQTGPNYGPNYGGPQGGPAGPGNGPASGTPVKKEKKGGNKTVLWIILGALAALLLAGGVFLFFALRNGTSRKGSSDPHLIIFTREGGIYIDSEEGVLVEKSEDNNLAYSLDAVLIERKNRLFYVKNGEETQIGGTGADLYSYDQASLAWVEYVESDGDICMFIPGNLEAVVLAEQGKEQMGWGYPSKNNKYYAYVCYTGKNYSTYSLRIVNLSTGENETIFENKYGIGLRGVDDKGYAYYVDDQGKAYVSSGEEVLIEDVSELMILDDLLLCKSIYRGEILYYTRPLGEKGELSSLSDKIDDDTLLEALEDSRKHKFIERVPYGYAATTIYNSSDGDPTNLILLEKDGDLYLLDAKAATAELLLEDTTLSRLEAFYLIEDKKQIYALKDTTLLSLTHSDKGWERERITKNCDRLNGVYQAGVVYLEDEKVVVYDGKEAVKMGNSGDCFDLSEDLTSLVYIDDSRVSYVDEPGGGTRRIARDSGRYQVALFDKYVLHQRGW